MKTVLPAAAPPEREGLDLAPLRVRNRVYGEAIHLILSPGAGEASLILGPEESRLFFSEGPVQFGPADPDKGPAFVDEVARWLGLELDEPSHDWGPQKLFIDEVLEADWVRMDESLDAAGTMWSTYKLYFLLGEHYAEVFLRLSRDMERAQLVEKWSGYREDFVIILERLLSSARHPRRVRRRPLIDPIPDGKHLFSIDGAMEIAIPAGWQVSQQPEGHWRINPADEEMTIDMSYLRLPPLPAALPAVKVQVAHLVETSEYRDRAAPIVHGRDSDIVWARTEYTFDSDDPKRPEAPLRPARVRWHLNSNGWVQVLFTGCWWEDDAAAAEPIWKSVISSLRLAGQEAIPRAPRAKVH